MPNKTEWYKTIAPLHTEDAAPDMQHVSSRVMAQLPLQAERKEIMPPKKRKRFMHPLIAIAAAIGISTLSLVTANAATDGALFSKLTLYLNGEQVETNIRFVEETDDKIVYEVLPEDSEGNIDPFQITQDKDGGADVAMNGTGNASEAELEIEMDVQE